jgi:hypothetical protein
MSKELVDTEDGSAGPAANETVPTIREEFMFWAKLMTLDEAPLDKLQYPSLSPSSDTSTRDYRGARDGWRCLYPDQRIHPPIVSLLD